MAFKHLFAAAAILVVSGLGPARADYDAGLAAYGVGDYATALQEWQPLAAEGLAQAQFNLAFMYDNGQGVAHDYRSAARWYSAAAEQGHPMAAWSLGMMYAAGQGVPQDYVQAYTWLSLSARLGDDAVLKDREAIAALMTPKDILAAKALVSNSLPEEQSIP